MSFQQAPTARPIDFRDLYATVTATHGTTYGLGGGTAVQIADPNSFPANYVTQTGRKAKLVAYQNAVGPGGANFVAIVLEVNGQPIGSQLLTKVTNQIGDPSNPDAMLPVWYDLPQGATIKAFAPNSDGANDYAATLRLRIFYYDPLADI